MSFKPHSDKTINVSKKDIATLDSVHNEKMREFHRNENEIIPKLQKEVEILKNKKKEKNAHKNINIYKKNINIYAFSHLFTGYD